MLKLARDLVDARRRNARQVRPRQREQQVLERRHHVDEDQREVGHDAGAVGHLAHEREQHQPDEGIDQETAPGRRHHEDRHAARALASHILDGCAELVFGKARALKGVQTLLLGTVDQGAEVAEQAVLLLRCGAQVADGA